MFYGYRFVGGPYPFTVFDACSMIFLHPSFIIVIIRLHWHTYIYYKYIVLFVESHTHIFPSLYLSNTYAICVWKHILYMITYMRLAARNNQSVYLHKASQSQSFIQMLQMSQSKLRSQILQDRSKAVSAHWVWILSAAFRGSAEKIRKKALHSAWLNVAAVDNHLFLEAPGCICTVFQTQLLEFLGFQGVNSQIIPSSSESCHSVWTLTAAAGSRSMFDFRWDMSQVPDWPHLPMKCHFMAAWQPVSQISKMFEGFPTQHQSGTWQTVCTASHRPKTPKAILLSQFTQGSMKAAPFREWWPDLLKQSK